MIVMDHVLFINFFLCTLRESLNLWWGAIIPHVVCFLFAILIIVILLQFIVKTIRKGLFGAIKDIIKEIEGNHNDYQK